MRPRDRFFARILGPLSSAIALGGCVGSTPPSRFYTVPALPMSTTAIQGASEESEEISLAIGPVQLPKHFDRPQIIRSRTGTQVAYSEYDRWAGPLDANVLDVLDRNLSDLLGTNRIVRFPWIGAIPVDYWVPVAISQWDVTPAGEVVLVARWRVHGSVREELYSVRTTRAVAVASSPAVPAVVEAMGEVLGELSREIAEEIVRIRESGVKATRLENDRKPAPAGTATEEGTGGVISDQ